MLNRPSELSQTDTQLPTSTKVSPKSKNQHGIPEIRFPILVAVPVETLTGITSYLDPPCLSMLATVNKYLSEHVKDDNTWRRAFVQQFLGIGPECDLGDEKTLLLRHTERSWRTEFIVHYTLIRRVFLPRYHDRHCLLIHNTQTLGTVSQRYHSPHPRAFHHLRDASHAIACSANLIHRIWNRSTFASPNWQNPLGLS